MATSSKKKTDTAAAPAAVARDEAPARPQVRWDDAQMRTSYANVCNVFGSREEITLLFGTNEAWQPGDAEARVALGERIVLTPYTAKRLAAMLDKGVAEYEKRFGKIEI